MRNDYTHMTMILDRSGSMASVQDDTIGGFNTFLAQQKGQAGHATLSLVQFDDQYERLHDFADINQVAPLSRKTFVPRGSTALLDAMGRAINETGRRLAALPEEQRPAKVIVVTLTDGQENASSDYDHKRISQIITHQREKYGWEFVFIGANQDAIATAATMGIAASHSITYAPTAAGQRDIMEKMSAGILRKRAAPAPAPGMMAESTDEFFTQEERDTLPDMASESPSAAALPTGKQEGRK